MRKSAVALILAAFAVALVVAGCGGSGGSGSSSAGTEAQGPPIAKAAFIKKADAICKAINEKIVEEGAAVLNEAAASGESRHQVEITVVSKITLPLLQEELDQLRGLGTPSKGADQVGEVIALTQKVIDEGKSSPAGYLHAQVNFEHPYEKAEKIAHAFGISSCPQV